MRILRTSERLYPIHPGEMLREEFMVPLGLASEKLAQLLCVPETRVEELLSEHARVNGEMALRLGRYFHTSAQFWMNLQAAYEIGLVSDEVAAHIERDIVPASLDQETGELSPSAPQPSHA